MLNWNLLTDFPNDRREEYEFTLRLLPLLRHLNPPSGVCSLIIDRFSPYFNRPDEYGITNVRPLESYAEVTPLQANLAKLAYHFVADYDSAARACPDLVRLMTSEVAEWRRLWTLPDAGPPVLSVHELGQDKYLLLDTRGLKGTQPCRFLTREHARVAWAGCRTLDRTGLDWAFDAQSVFQMDDWIVPLATAQPGLLRRFERPERFVELPLVTGV